MARTAGPERCMRLVGRLLWIDCIAAALAGTVVLAFVDALAEAYAMPSSWLRTIGAINLLYACLSGTLAIRRRRPMSWIVLLCIANGAWSMACVGIAVTAAGTATPFGMAHLLGEGLFVGSLAALEWRWRDRLATS